MPLAAEATLPLKGSSPERQAYLGNCRVGARKGELVAMRGAAAR